MFKKKIILCIILTSMLFGCAETPKDILKNPVEENVSTSYMTENMTNYQEFNSSINEIIQDVQNGKYGYIKFTNDVQINIPTVDTLSIIELKKKSMDFDSYVNISKECFKQTEEILNDNLYFWKPFTTDFSLDENGTSIYLEPKLYTEYPNNNDSGYLMYQDKDTFQMTVYYSSNAKNYSNFQYRYISNTLLNLNNNSTSYVDKYNVWENKWHDFSNFDENGIKVLDKLTTSNTDVSHITWNLNGTNINILESINSIENNINENTKYTLSNVSFKVKDIFLCEYSSGQQALYYNIQAYFNNFPLDYNNTNYDAINKFRDSFQGNVISLDGKNIDFYNNPFPILENINSTERYNNYLDFKQSLNIVKDMLSDTINYSFNEVNLEYSIVLNDDNTISLEPCYCFVMDNSVLSNSKIYLWVNAITGETDSCIYTF